MGRSIFAGLGSFCVLVGAWALLAVGSTPLHTLALANSADKTPASGPIPQFLQDHCLACHKTSDKKGNLDLEALDLSSVAKQPVVWEKVLRKLVSRQMPPAGRPRPSEREFEAVIAPLESDLDRVADLFLDPGRTPTFRRLNRTEYRNTIRDLLALEIDAEALLPADEANHGFDSAPLGGISPTLMERYLAAAQKIARQALGRVSTTPDSQTFRVPADRTQEGPVTGLPLGTRGGTAQRITFPREGEYDLQVWLTRDRNEMVEGLSEPHEMVILLDRQQKASFTVKPAGRGEGQDKIDAHLKTRIKIPAGPHELGVTFLPNDASLLETKRQPYEARFNLHRHPRTKPAIYQVSLVGPYNFAAPAPTPSRRQILGTEPIASNQEEDRARQVLSRILRRAYRQPVSAANLEKALKFYRQGRREGSFEAGIELALGSILVNPQFLFRIEQDPKGLFPGGAYRLSDLDLASRLSFFLWSSIPDDELLDLAERKELQKPEVWEAQVRRLLADPRAENLATHFAVQWLHLGNLEAITPDLRLFPDFDDNLRQAFRKETELFVDSVFRGDHSIPELLQSDATFLNERLAKHYAIPHVFGDRFRKVDLEPQSRRGGLLRQGSILTVTSYATRTSPVLRGKWILENLLGTTPPPPPANVPSLRENTVSASLPIRQRLAEHRDNPACASCHRLIDPVGFPLEQFDAVGRWRSLDDGHPVDAAGGLPGQGDCEGVAGLEKAFLERPDLFARTLAEKLFTFALGRSPEPTDAAAIRRIVREAKKDHDRFSALILALTQSPPFQMRRSP